MSLSGRFAASPAARAGSRRAVSFRSAVVDVTDFARAAEIAARAHACPVPEGAPNYPVVVRPVDEGAGPYGPTRRSGRATRWRPAPPARGPPG
ncbi:hypothetical protein [Streptomyces sp. NPDC054901]